MFVSLPNEETGSILVSYRLIKLIVPSSPTQHSSSQPASKSKLLIIESLSARAVTSSIKARPDHLRTRSSDRSHTYLKWNTLPLDVETKNSSLLLALISVTSPSIKSLSNKSSGVNCSLARSHFHRETLFLFKKANFVNF